MKPTTLNRNNTNFPLQVLEYVKNAKISDEYKFLKYYQNIIRNYFSEIDINSRGLLLYLQMGLGKSMIAVSIAMDLYKEYPPIILAGKSLHENMRVTIIKYVRLRSQYDPYFQIGKLPDKDLDDWINKKFAFVSMNASNMMKQLSLASDHVEESRLLESKLEKIVSYGTLDNKLVIVDEAHNLFRAITNGSKNALSFYHMVMKAKELKLLFLTGTPVSNDSFELVPCFNMLGSKKGIPIFPRDWKTFYKYYVDSGTGNIINKGKFQNRIYGLVSHLSHADLKIESAAVEFPEEKPLEIVFVKMDNNQFTMYNFAREKEREESKSKARYKSTVENIPELQKPKSDLAGSYRVRSRQLSNYAPPHEYIDYILGVQEEGTHHKSILYKIPEKDIIGNKLEAIRTNIEKSPGIGIVYSQFIGVGGLGILIRYLLKFGYTIYHEQQSYIKKLITIQESAGESVGESAGESVGESVRESVGESVGESVRESAGESVGESIYGSSQTKKSKVIGVVFGTIKPEQRDYVQKIFSSDANKNGGLIDILLISSTGAEGLDLKNARHGHIMEPYWNWQRIAQVKSRIIRNDSHIALPKEERNVQIYVYLSILPNDTVDAAKLRLNGITVREPISDYSNTRDPTGDDQETLNQLKFTDYLTTDLKLFSESLRNQRIIDSFNDALREVSIECNPNHRICRLCNPDNNRLYTDNIDLDIRGIDRCKPVKEKTISAIEIKVNDKSYFYNPDPNSIYGYKLYMYDETIDGYKSMSEDSIMFQKILDEIKKIVKREKF